MKWLDPVVATQITIIKIINDFCPEGFEPNFDSQTVLNLPEALYLSRVWCFWNRHQEALRNQNFDLSSLQVGISILSTMIGTSHYQTLDFYNSLAHFDNDYAMNASIYIKSPITKG